MSKIKDLTGQKFGRWVVIERADNRNGKAYWLCKCECGNEKVVLGANLKSGKSTNCGCLRNEAVKKMNEEKWKDENFRQKIKNATKQKWEDEEYRNKMSEKMKKQNEEQWKDEEFRKKMSESLQQKWEDEEFRQKVSESLQQKWKDEEFRQKVSEKMKKQNEEQWKDEEFRKKMSEKMKEQKGEHSHNWKGGITSISKYLRNFISPWFDLCKQQANYTCQLTGERGTNLHTHHLKSFNSIIVDGHNLYNIKIRERIVDYTDEELTLLIEYVENCHKDNTNAVVLCEKVHILFHALYGKGNNTPEQYIEFKERYLAGEFKEILKIREQK